MKYQKPKQFSDPYHDWFTSDDLLCAILAKADNSLTTADYSVIFAQNLPAANYQEGAYYIEKCLEHIGSSHEVNANRFPDGFLCWLAHFRDDLVRDDLYAEIKRSLASVFWRLLDQFELFELTKAECKQMGREFEWAVGPYNQHTVWHFIDELTINDEFEPELDAIADRLITSESLAHIRWYVEIAAHSRMWAFGYDERFLQLDNYHTKEALFHKLHHFPVLKRKVLAAMQKTREEGKEKYNHLVRRF